MEEFTYKGHVLRYEMTEITPEMAQRWLDKVDNTNRPRKKRKVAQYRKDIRNGNFPPGDSNILIGLDGRPLNGVHRLTAIVLENTPTVQMVIYDYPEDYRVHLDQGSPRTAGDYLFYRGVKNARVASTGIKRFLSIDRGATVLRTTADRSGDGNFSIGEIVKAYDQHPKEFDFASDLALKVTGSIPLQTGSIIGLIAFLKIRRRHDDKVIENFFLDLAGKRDGVTIDINSNIGQLRALLIQENNNKANGYKALPAQMIQKKLIYVWNHYIDGTKIVNLSQISGLGEQIPK